MKNNKILDVWTWEKIKNNGSFSSNLSREILDAYTMDKLRETVEFARNNSLFYREKFKEATVDSLEEFQRLPFTNQADLRERGMEFLCVRQSEISRVVTLETSGTTGTSKRIYFTEEDQELTVDYFAHGMQLIANPEDVVLILMPSRAPGSIGTLLAEGLGRFGAAAIRYGVPRLKKDFSFKENVAEIDKLIRVIERDRVTGIVALPTQLEILANYVEENKKAKMPESTLKWVLLSGEYVSDNSVCCIKNAFNCKVYEHYGMTEMGLGCAVSCGQGEGYHVRESDLYIEIIDGMDRVVKDGEFGEIAVTTLTRKGMPFIRYKTGDYSRWIVEKCSCGSVLKRLDKVAPRSEIKGYLR